MNAIIERWGSLLAEALADAAIEREQRISIEFAASLECLAYMPANRRWQIAESVLAWMHSHGTLAKDGESYYFPYPKDVLADTSC